MTKSRDNPISRSSRPIRRAHKEWNVDTHILLQSDPSSDSTRERISSAALFVNVTARICGGLACASPTKYAIRLVMTRVLPDPAPARIRRGPLIRRTASRCSGLRAERKFIDSLVVPGAWCLVPGGYLVPGTWWVPGAWYPVGTSCLVGSVQPALAAIHLPTGQRGTHQARGTPILQSRTS